MITRSTVPSDFSTILRSGNSRSSGAALVAGVPHRAVGGIKRLEDFFRNRRGGVVGASGHRKLRLLVMQPRRRADHHAMECVRAFAAVGADHHAHRKRGTILVGRSEHRSLEMRSGSIGTTRSGKYTELPRSTAVRSSAEPGRT